MHAYLSLRFWKKRCKDLLLAVGIVSACATEQERLLFPCPFHFPKHAHVLYDIVTCTRLYISAKRKVVIVEYIIHASSLNKIQAA